MSEETTDQLNVEEPQGTDTTDWKAEARKWEKYAKENKAAKDELDALKAAQMTEHEKLVKRAEDAEKALAEATARIQHANDVAEIAAQSGVPTYILDVCSSREAMESLVEKFKADMSQVHSAPQAPKSRIVGGDTVKLTNGDVFAELAEQLFTS